MQIASLLNHELSEGWPQADSYGTVHNGMSPVGRVGSSARPSYVVAMLMFPTVQQISPVKPLSSLR